MSQIQPILKGSADLVAQAEQDDDAIPQPRKPDGTPEQHPRFLLTHHWLGWEFLGDGKGGGEFLPRINRVPLIPGVDGVDDNLTPNKLIARLMGKGTTVWVNGDRALGPYAHFLGQYKIRGSKGKAFVVRFAERANIMPGATPYTRFKTDEQAWLKFRRHVRDHVLPPMTDIAYDQIVEVAKRTAAQQEQVYRDPEAHAVKSAFANLAALQAAGEKYFAAVAETGTAVAPAATDDGAEPMTADKGALSPAEEALARRKAGK